MALQEAPPQETLVHKFKSGRIDLAKHKGRPSNVYGTVQGNIEQTDWSKWSQPKTTVTDVRLDSGMTVQVSPCGYRPGDRLEMAYAGFAYTAIQKLPF